MISPATIDQLERAACATERSLLRGSVASILLTGPAVSRRLYAGDPETRPYGDLDLLVDPAQLEAAETVLANEGFQVAAHAAPAGLTPKVRTWTRDSDGVIVELHRVLPGADAPSDAQWRHLFGESEPLALPTGEVRVLQPIPFLVLVALRAAEKGQGAKQLEDLRRALARFDVATWEAASHFARRLDAERSFAMGMRLDRDGRQRAAQFGLSSRVSTEVAIQATSDARYRDGALALVSLKSHSGPRARLVFAAGKIAPPSAWMREFYPLARRGRVGLALAYQLRAISLLVRLGPVLDTWRRARKVARGTTST